MKRLTLPTLTRTLLVKGSDYVVYTARRGSNFVKVELGKLRRGLAALFVAAICVLLTAPAQAATVLNFERRQAAPGQRISGTTDGAGMQGIASGRVVVLLAPSDRAADQATGLTDPDLVRFGVMTADDGEVGHFTGTVPAIEAGSYVAVAFCRDCGGGGVFTIGEFRVTGSSLPATGGAFTLWVIVGSLSLLGGASLLFRFPSSRPRDQSHRSRAPRARS